RLEPHRGGLVDGVGDRRRTELLLLPRSQGLSRTGLRLHAEGSPHERMYPAEVRVGAGRQILRGLPGVAVGGRRPRDTAVVPVEAELARVEGHRPVGDRVGDAGPGGAGVLAGRDRVEGVDAGDGVEVVEGERLARLDRGDTQPGTW